MSARSACNIIGDVAVRDVIIVDDMIDTANPLQRRTGAYDVGGAKNIYAAPLTACFRARR